VRACGDDWSVESTHSPWVGHVAATDLPVWSCGSLAATASDISQDEFGEGGLRAMSATSLPDYSTALLGCLPREGDVESAWRV
jgi:hypothetical protein